jgi:hypothetical protein
MKLHYYNICCESESDARTDPAGTVTVTLRRGLVARSSDASAGVSRSQPERRDMSAGTWT